ncbi:transcription factor Adf-1-like [Anastrepha ludens]|uniref:transcription factor Adf-1-like n=1 Tax=Anastrepha ludens TaxID=28586 RepID=UPI0023B1A951|nr:transcription factor Adf-1-like [Anastrepha ludens]
MALNDEQLVSLVEDKKELYDKSNPLYKLQGRKAMIWEQMGKELGTSGEVYRRRWLALRDRYGREARKSEAPSGSGADYQRPWYLLESMAFLRPHVIPRPCSQNVCPAVPSLTLSPLPPLPEEEFLDDVDPPFPSTSATSPPQSQRTSGKKRDRSAEVEKGILEAIDLLKKRCLEKENRPNNSADSFGCMIGSMVGKMSAAKQARAMQGILDVVFKVQQEPE